MIQLARPWVMALVIPALIFIAYRLFRLRTQYAPWRFRFIATLTLLAALLAGLAAAGFALGRRVDRMAVIYVLDRSRSVEFAGGDSADRIGEIAGSLEAMNPGDKAGLVVFGASAATTSLPAARPTLRNVDAPVSPEGTDIGAAIRHALADLPAEHNARVVLLSDGVTTSGDALAAAEAAALRGVPVDVLPVEREPRPEVGVSQVRVADTVRVGEAVEVRVVTRSTRDTRARIIVERDGAPFADGVVDLAAGEDLLVLRDRASTAGVHRYTARVEPLSADDDTAIENNEGGAFLRVTGRARALVLSGSPEAARPIADAIDAGPFDVELKGATEAPNDLAEMVGYDLIVLSDISARAFSEAQLAALKAYVEQMGGGLVMAGARESFGLGGYAGTPVEDVLPATLDLRKRRDRASLAMIIAIDRSGSMGAAVDGSRNKLDLANEAAARSANLLASTDRVGVMHVDTAVHWTVPMQNVNDPAAIAAMTRAATPGGGGIYVDVTARTSYATLRREQIQLKHLLLFSDGADSERMGGVLPIVRRANESDRITTSVVSMGRGTDTPELERLAKAGDGRFYIVEDLRELPRIFTQETIEAARSAIVEEAFQVQSAGDLGPLRGIDFSQAPPLGGHAIVTARPRARLLLSATDNDPLLLTWQKGVGRSAVYATDVGGEFGASWLPWPGHAQLFEQIARDIARPSDGEGAHMRVFREGSQGKIVVEAISQGGQYRNYLSLTATVAGPGGEPIEVPLEQTGAGRYEGEFSVAAPGAYLARVADEDGQSVGTAGIVRPRGDELRGDGTDMALLSQIAMLSGGRVRENLNTVFADRLDATYARIPIERPLLWAAVFLFFISVAARRLSLSLAPLLRRLRPNKEPSRDDASPIETLAALNKRKAEGKRQVAEEIRAATNARPNTSGKGASPSSPSAGSTAPATRSGPGKAANPASGGSKQPDKPAGSLAEKLLERKKKRR